MLLEDLTGQERDDGDRHKERRDDREHHRHGQASDKVATPLRQEGQGQESQQQGNGAADHGNADLLGGQHGRFLPGMAHAQESLDILHDNDTVVHQQSQGDHHPDNAQLIEGVSHQVQQGQPNGQGQWNGDHHYRGGAHTQWQQGEQDQGDGDQEVLPQPRQAPVHTFSLVKGQIHMDRRRQTGFKGFEDRGELFPHLDDVLLVLHGHIDPKAAFPIVSRQIALLLFGIPHLGDILQPGQSTRSRGHHHGGTDICQGGELRIGFDIEAPRADIQAAPGNIHIVRLDRSQHLVDPQSAASQLVQVQLDGDLPLRYGLYLDGLDIPELLDLLFQLLRMVPDRLQICQFRMQGDLHDHHIRAGRADHIQGDQSIRKLGSQLVDLPDHVIVLRHRVHLIDKLDLHEHQAVITLRGDLLDIVQLVDHLLDRIGHQFLHVGRAGARIDAGDHIDGRIEGRVLSPGHVDQRIEAEGQDHHEDDDGKGGILDRKGSDFHDI